MPTCEGTRDYIGCFSVLGLSERLTVYPPWPRPRQGCEDRRMRFSTKIFVSTGFQHTGIYSEQIWTAKRSRNELNRGRNFNLYAQLKVDFDSNGSNAPPETENCQAPPSLDMVLFDGEDAPSPPTN